MYVPAPLLNPAHNPGTCNCIEGGGGFLKMSKCNKNWVYIVKISLKLCIIQAKCCPQNYDFVRIWYLDVKVKIYYFIIYSPRAAHNLQCPHPEQLVNRVWFQWPCRWFLCLPAATAGRQYALVSLCYQYVWGFGHTSIVLLCWWVWRS